MLVTNSVRISISLLSILVYTTLLFLSFDCFHNRFSFNIVSPSSKIYSNHVNSYSPSPSRSRNSVVKMNFFEDATRFFTNLNKEASAKHILMTGPDASKKLSILKTELESSEDISAAFSELASKVLHKFCSS